MASKVDWSDLLDKKYNSYKVEVSAYLDSLDVSNSSDISMQFIYDRIRHAPKVHENLKLLYKEVIYGSEKAVKMRIRNRLANFKRSLKYVYSVFLSLIFWINFNFICTIWLIYYYSGVTLKFEVWIWCMQVICQPWIALNCSLLFNRISVRTQQGVNK